MNLPFEIQFKFLLELPYQDIISYCQINSHAASICETEDFWDSKSMNEFDVPLDTVSGLNPAHKYQILSQIMNSDDPVIAAIKMGQANLVRAFWRPEDVYDLDPDLILDILEKDHLEVVEALFDLIQDKRDLLEPIAEDAYNLAHQQGYFHLLSYFSPYFDVRYILSLVDLVDNFGDHTDGIDLIIDDARQHHHPEVIQKFASWLLHQSDYTLLNYMLDKYPEDIDKEKLAQQAREDI